MDGQWGQVAEALVAALAPALPDGFGARLEPEAGGIVFFQQDVPHAWVVVRVQLLIEQPGDERVRLEAVCYSVLSTAQDLVAEFTGRPWPGGEKELPLPGVEVLDGEVHLWYGEQETPTLVVGRIPR